MKIKDDDINRRESPRHKAPSEAYVSILSGETETAGFLVDLSMKGASFEYIYSGSLLPEHDQIDILYDREAFHIENIPCRFIFDISVDDQPHEPVNWRRVGIRFGELATKQKNHLRHLLNHYWGYPMQLLEDQPVPSMDSDDIFLARLKLLVIAAKAYLKDYPFGEYRKKAIVRNAKEISQTLEKQSIFHFGDSHSLLFKEQIILLAKAFIKMPIKSYGKADIQNSVDYISGQLTGGSLLPVEFLKVA